MRIKLSELKMMNIRKEIRKTIRESLEDEEIPGFGRDYSAEMDQGNKKYRFTGEERDGLKQIVALRSFGSVKKGTRGGWIEGEKNLSHEGNCWVSGNASVFEDAWVFGNAKVSGNASVSGDAKVSENAKVSGNAKVSENAWVFGNAKVSGDAWVSKGKIIKGKIIK